MGLRPTEGDENGTASGGRLILARNGRGRFRSGEVETAKEFDPGRV